VHRDCCGHEPQANVRGGRPIPHRIMLNCSATESDAALGKRPIFTETVMPNGEFSTFVPKKWRR